MQTQEFLDLILPDEGFYCLAKPHEKGYFVHRVFEHTSDMARVALELDQNLEDVYFAIASLKQPRVFDPAKNDGKGGYRYRTKSNIHSLKAIFFEADVLRPDEMDEATEAELSRKYTSQNEAIKSIKLFCQQLGWPLPTVVGSGWGFHFYWPLEQSVDTGNYEVLVKKLKLAAKHFKFKLDVSAADISRVFRVPGTRNHKRADDRKKVVVHKASTPVSFDDLHGLLDDALDAAKVSVGDIQPRMNIPDYLNFGESNIQDEREPLKLKPMMQKCGAMREVMENPDHVSYHTWYRTIQVIRHCNDGDNLIHKVSSLANSYSVEETDKMIRTLAEKDIPPTLCDTFSKDSDACAACPYRGKIKSPAAFGREAAAAKQNAMLTMQAAIGQMPPPPHPYKHVPGKGVIVEKSDKDGNKYDEVIFQYDLEPVKRLFSERENKEIVLWKTNNPADGFVEVEMPSASLYDKKSFSSALADAGIYADLHQIDPLRGYMISYTQQIQKLYRKEFQYGRLGWREDGRFVLGNKIYTDTQVQPCNTEHGNRVMASIEESGDIDSWKRILSFLEGAEFAGHQFAIGIGFGSVLMPFTGIEGGIVNLTGRSGEGKSTVQKIVNSIWGHPKKLMLPAEAKSSTYNAKISFINMMNNLPICAEEITNATQDEVGSLAYAINQGTEKWRSDIKGDVRDSRGGWCTIMLASSNDSLHLKIEGSGGAAAKALRVFEYPLPKVRKNTKAEFQQGVDLQLLEHYGLAGPLYMRYVQANLAAVRQELRETMLRIDLAYTLTSEERVWSALLACSLTGLRIAKRLGLHNFFVADVEEFVGNQLASMRRSVDNMALTAQEVLADYLSANIRNMLVIERTSVGGVATDYVIQKPFGSLDIRFEADKQHLILATTPFKKWCIENNHPFTEVLTSLHDEGMLLHRSTKRTLSSGTGYSTGQIRAMILDASTPAFSGGLKLINNSIQSNTGTGN